MLSLYIHIPFCRHKCNYCSFFVVPEIDTEIVEGPDKLEQLKEQYLESLLAENASWKSQFPEQQLKTIYIGGGTPFQLGPDRLFRLLDSVFETRDCEFLEEVTIELNPDPFDEVLDFIRQANRTYKHLYKLRFSIGIQTFDDEILQSSKRNYIFNNLIWFFRDLQKIKQPFTHYNFDFIAFGKKGAAHPRSDPKMEFFMKLVNSQVADGYSLYTLELFPGSSRYNQTQQSNNHVQWLQGNEEGIYEEFDILKTIIQQAGYERYEVSNFALRSKPSIHNMVYRNMEPYIGLGINSSSFLPQKLVSSSGGAAEGSRDLSTPLGKGLAPLKMTDGVQGIRFQNTKHWKKYLAGKRLDTASIEPLDETVYRTEKAFLALRTGAGLKEFSSYSDLFEPHRQENISLWAEEGLIHYNEETDTLKLTDAGMNVYNGLITDLFASL